MSITVREMFGENKMAAPPDFDYVRMFVVQSSADIEESSAIVAVGDNGVNIPAYNALHPRSGSARVTTKNAQQPGDTKTLWNVSVNYSSKKGPAATRQYEDPFARIPLWNIDGITFPEPFDVDVDGLAVVNTAYYPFDPGLMRPAKVRVLTVTRAERVFDPLMPDVWEDSVNSGPWNYWGSGQVRVESINAVEAFESAILYWNVTYIFHIRKNKFVGTGAATAGFGDAWKERPLNVGFTNRAGVKWTGPDPRTLNAAGAFAALGTRPSYVEFTRCPARNFNLLNLTI